MIATYVYRSISVNGDQYLLVGNQQGLSFIGAPNQTLADFQLGWGPVSVVRDDQQLRAAAGQLQDWLLGKRSTMDVSVDFSLGTAFQQQVWQMLRQIPLGERWSYSQLATALHQASAVRAVASAVAKNPLLFVVPCHRVVRKDGSLGQYRGGQALKASLLQREAQG